MWATNVCLSTSPEARDLRHVISIKKQSRHKSWWIFREWRCSLRWHLTKNFAQSYSEWRTETLKRRYKKATPSGTLDSLKELDGEVLHNLDTSSVTGDVHCDDEVDHCVRRTRDWKREKRVGFQQLLHSDEILLATTAELVQEDVSSWAVWQMTFLTELFLFLSEINFRHRCVVPQECKG